MRDPMGEGAESSGVHADLLIAGLSGTPSSFVLFIQLGDMIVGMATCFVNFSTFAAKSYINVHDFFIAREYRTRGCGTALMNELLAVARRRD